MKTKQGYNLWADTYDSLENATRDLEASVIRRVLPGSHYETILELGCGTGKNTGFLSTCAKQLIAVDFSKSMLDKAQEQLNDPSISFHKADIRSDWNFLSDPVDVISCSLVLEHIEDLNPIFQQAASHLVAEGIFYIGELHPFRQYRGSRANFERDGDRIEPDCFVHHISNYLNGAQKAGLHCLQLDEWFDDGDRSEEPRLVSFLFQKS